MIENTIVNQVIEQPADIIMYKLSSTLNDNLILDIRINVHIRHNVKSTLYEPIEHILNHLISTPISSNI